LSDQSINAGSGTSYTLPACNDPESAVCSFIGGITPSFGTFDPGSRTYTFNPVTGDEDTYLVTFSITDGSASNTYNFDVTVQPLPPPPPAN